MLIIAVEKPGTFEDSGLLDTIATTASSLGQLLMDSARMLSFTSPSLYFPPELDAQDIRYVQDSISSLFQCGRRLVDTMTQLRNGSIPSTRFQPFGCLSGEEGGIPKTIAACGHLRRQA